ncbi:MAG: hypothetical protein KAU06_06085 [Candidatus Marinimicrobia bacterium]|nr:hypothetical protein [Candidatus Neomarinimicrobiota bacterium]
MKSIKKLFYTVVIISTVFLFIAAALIAQDVEPLGDRIYRKEGMHNGNKVRTIFSNTGLVAGDATGNNPEGEWPRGSGNSYVGDVSPLFGVELHRNWEWTYLYDGNTDNLIPIDYPDQGIDSLSQLMRLSEYYSHRLGNDTLYVQFADTVTSIATADGPRGWTDGPGGGLDTWTLEPLPGYADEQQEYIALSDDLDNDGDGKPDTWPWYWPDKPTWIDPTGIPYWNGYFGRGVMAADQESYFVIDDSEDFEFNFYRQGAGPRVFLPDSTNPMKYGSALRVSVRGLQWSHFLAEDIIYWLYEVKNNGTTNYPKVTFGMMVGTLSGGRCNNHIDAQDDLSFFDNQNDITYSWDAPPSYSPCYDGPVGYAGYAFLESPGNPFDGIDNDGDSEELGSPLLNESFFQPNNYKMGDEIILIEPETYARVSHIIEQFPDTVFTGGKRIILTATSVLEEVVGNLIDDNLNGIIDEDYFTHYYNRLNRGEGFQPLPPLKYIDYRSGAGLNDPMIDERRDDGIDNDGDWDAVLHDVGADGVPGTADNGEGDGIPTAGEPNFDAVDVNESDQIGLTSFNYFTPPGKVRMSDDFKWSSKTPGELWTRQTPGNYDEIVLEPADGDFIYGSGYFPLLVGTSERFSMALLFGEDFEDILRNKEINQQIYNNNYQFTRPPDKPTVHAVAGDGKMTLYWDNAAEFSVDPVLGKDFEGYKIYRATDIGFNEINSITNADGIKYFYEPIAQFDLENGIRGFYRGEASFTGGISFYLGEDTGLQYTYTDTTVNNGMTYYYAVVSYDHGDASTGIFPAECSKTIQELGDRVLLDKNTVAIQPTGNVAGYIPPDTSRGVSHIAGEGDGSVYYHLVNPAEIPPESEHYINIHFFDTATDWVDNNGDGLFYSEDTLVYEFRDTVLYIPAQYDSQVVTITYSTNNGKKDTTIIFPPTLKDVDEAFSRMTTYYAIYDNYFNRDGDEVIDTVIDKSSRFGIDDQSVANIAKSLNTLTTLVFPKEFTTIPDYPLGMQLFFTNTWLTEISSYSWNSSAAVSVEPQLRPWVINGHQPPGDYELTFGRWSDQSFATDGQYGSFTSININVVGRNLWTGKDLDIAVRDDGDGQFGIEDTLVFFEWLPATTQSNPNAIQQHATWMLTFHPLTDTSTLPTASAALTIETSKPLTLDDIFEIEITGAQSDPVIATKERSEIGVVPNPYFSTAIWEPRNNLQQGRAERRIDFINIPVYSTIRIYTVRGDLVQVIRHDGSYNDGSVSWDLLSRDGLPISYGVYVFHVSGPNLTEDFIGKFAVIK